MDIKSMESLPRDFVLYLEEHPNYSGVVFSGEKVNILELLKENAKFFPQIRAAFPGISETRLELILIHLTELHLVGKLELDQGFMYFVTNEGVDLLERLKKVKEGFSL
ncbi:MAG: hypothetical protein J7K00_05615 [Candidatus Diapherotrites archaeon]|nr:hypothetical protein [Candidatus Diapherotrites archaeon]